MNDATHTVIDAGTGESRYLKKVEGGYLVKINTDWIRRFDNGPFTEQVIKSAFGNKPTSIISNIQRAQIIADAVGLPVEDVMSAFEGVEQFQYIAHTLAVNSGWWDNERNDGEMLCLMHSELSEAMEGVRKNKDDDHLPHIKSVDVELADCLVRIGDYCGGREIDLSQALLEKMVYNMSRVDHTREARAKDDGKKF